MSTKPFDIAVYNQTLLIHEADERFQKQLASAGISRKEFLSQLAPLFMEDAHAGRYSACLIHRHYLLAEGERMVTNGNSSRPSKDASSNIVPERWLATGYEFEYFYTENPISLPPPPSLKFLAKFKSIVDTYGVDTIGVCYTPPIKELSPGSIFLEVTGTREREQITKVVTFSSSKSSIYEAIWTPRVDSRGQFELVYNCGCEHPPFD